MATSNHLQTVHQKPSIIVVVRYLSTIVFTPLHLQQPSLHLMHHERLQKRESPITSITDAPSHIIVVRTRLPPPKITPPQPRTTVWRSEGSHHPGMGATGEVFLTQTCTPGNISCGVERGSFWLLFIEPELACCGENRNWKPRER